VNPKTNREVLDEAMRIAVPENVNLVPQITARYSKRRSVLKTRKNISIGIALVLLALLAGLFIWPQTAAAMRRLLGYIPGMGVVEPGNSLRVLAEPVVLEREGVTVTIEKGTADLQRTILRISVKGINANGGPYCESPMPRLRLKDGTTLTETFEAGNIGGDQAGSGYTNLSVFPALPARSNAVTMEIPCLWRVTRPENWEIPLHFVAADPTKLNQVIEFPPVMPTTQLTPIVQHITTAQLTATGQPINESQYGIAWSLDKVILLEDGYLLIGSTHWSDKNVEVSPSLSAIDAKGQPIVLEDPGAAGVEPGVLSPQDESSLRVAWVYKISGKEHAWPLTLKMDADVTYPADVSFSFDPGASPSRGMKWNLDQVLTVNGHAIRIVSATWMENIPGAVLQIEMQADDPDVVGVHVTDKPYHEVQRLCGGGGGGSEPGKLDSQVVYCEALTPKPRILTVDSISLRIRGPWQIHWQP
jgi:hypothetical protein